MCTFRPRCIQPTNKVIRGPFSEKVLIFRGTKFCVCYIARICVITLKFNIKIVRQCHYRYQQNGMDSLSLPLPNVVTITLKGNGNDILRVTVMTHLREFLNCSC